MPSERRIRTAQWEGFIAGILMLPILLAVLYLINTSLAEWSVLFVTTELLFVGFLVGDVLVVVRAARRLGLIGRPQ